jgi:hypothetical protein
MEISTDVKSHVIITMQGGHYFINERLNTQLEKMSLDDMLTTPDGAQIKVSTIVEVIPTSQYYDQHPEKRPVQRGDNWTEQRLTGNVFTRSKVDGRKIMLDVMKRKYPNASFAKLANTRHKHGDTYQPEHVFDMSKETWEEFKERTGVAFNN